MYDAAAWSTRSGRVVGAAGATTFLGGDAPRNLVSPTFVSFPIESRFASRLTLTAVSLPVPEPALLALLAVGLLGAWIVRS